jgi:hypothetical protein
VSYCESRVRGGGEEAEVRTVKEGEDVYKVLMNDLYTWPEELSSAVTVAIVI